MKQFKYSYEDLLKNKVRYLIITAQILVALVLVNLFFTNALKFYKFSQQISVMKTLENFYLLYDKTDSSTAHQIVSDDNNFLKIKELNDYIYNNKLFECYMMTSVYDTTVLNSKFLEISDFKLKSGEIFSENDFSQDIEITPAIIGFNLGKKYKVGDMISDSIDNKYKVKGILKRGETRLELKSRSEPIPLDNAILIPVQHKKNLNIPYYDMILHSTMIKTDNIENLNLIIDKSNELGLFNYHFKNLQTQISEIEQSYKQTFTLYLFLTSIILIFLCISIYSTLIQYIEKYVFEFSIHIIYGATHIDLFKRMFYQISIIFFVANLINIIFFNPQNLIYTITFSILVALSISYLIYYKIKSNKLLSLVKGD